VCLVTRTGTPYPNLSRCFASVTVCYHFLTNNNKIIIPPSSPRFFSLHRWSEYGTGEANGNNPQSGCGGDGSAESWYLGRTQCFRANAAYSLYGIKAGADVPANPCASPENYINSLFTTGGIESFGGNVGVNYNYYGVSTTCTATNNGQAAEGEPVEGEDAAAQMTRDHNQLYYSDYTSTTLGCSASGEFVLSTFQGAYCSGNHFLSSSADYADFNEDLSEVGCYEIFSYDNHNNPSLALLEASSVCSHSEYSQRCPDPHGMKRKRDTGLFLYSKLQNRAVPMIMPILSAILLLFASGFYAMANGVREGSKRRAMEAVTGETLNPTASERFAVTVQRVGTDISQRTRSFTEKLAEYAEEEEQPVPKNEDGSIIITNDSNAYKAPSASSGVLEGQVVAGANSTDPSTGGATSADLSTGAVASTRGAEEASEEAVISAPAETGKKYKRPRMAKISLFFRKRFGRKSTI